MDVQELKKLFAAHLCEAESLRPPESLPTGFEELDRFLLGGGLPKGALSLFKGELGTGATSLWIETAAKRLASGRWVAWINHDVPLSPLPLQQRGLPLEHVVAIEKPENDEMLFWLLQELMASSLFDLIGCDLGEMRLKEHQLRKLQAQARDAQLALVLISQGRSGALVRGSAATLFSLILKFDRREMIVERALHRPTPHRIARSVSYDRFTLHTTDRIVSGPKNERSPEHAKLEPDSGLEGRTAPDSNDNSGSKSLLESRR
jgi:recombination protein RecA